MKLLLSILIIVVSTGLKAQKLDTIKGTSGTEETYEDIFVSLNGGCSLGCGIGWTFSATSALPSQSNNSYIPENLADGKKETAWIEGADDYGIGKRIIIQFENDVKIRNVPLREIIITNGYAKDLESWQANSRVKRFKLTYNDQDQFIIELIDSIYPQFVFFRTEIFVSSGDVITLEILEVYQGSKFKDTAISDLSLMGGH